MADEKPKKRKVPAVVRPDPLPWERQKGETRQAFNNFAYYRDLGPYRTLAKAAADLHKARQTLAEQSAKYGWDDRVTAYDDDYDRRRREERESERAQLERTERGVGAAMIAPVIARLRGRDAGVAQNGEPVEPVEPLDPNNLAASDLASLAKTGFDIQRRALGMPTDLIRGSLVVTPAEATKVFRDLIELSTPFVPEERQPRWFAEIEAYIEAGRR